MPIFQFMFQNLKIQNEAGEYYYKERSATSYL